MRHSLYPFKLFLFLLIYVSLSLSIFSVEASTGLINKQVISQREYAVRMIYNGEVDNGLFQLHALLNQHSTDPYLLADYFTLKSKYQQLSIEDLQYIHYINLSTYPTYAYIPTLQGLRNAKQFVLAKHLAEQMYLYLPSNDLLLIKAVLNAESQNFSDAIQDLRKLGLSHLSIDQQIQSSYAWRISHHAIESLNLIYPLYEKNKNNPQITEEYLYTLMALDNSSQALQVIEQSSLNKTHPELLLNIQLSAFNQGINNAFSNYKYLLDKGESESSSFQSLDKILNNAEQLKSLLTPENSQFLPFYYNYIYALGLRKNFTAVLRYAHQLNRSFLEMPAYVRHSIANAYLYLKQPAKAEPLYQSLLLEKNYADIEVYSGLYYSYLEQEKYKSADLLAQQIDTLIPTFRYSHAKGVDKTTAPDRYEYISLKGLNYGYQNHLNQAEQYFYNILEKSPNNEAYINNLATVQRWRGLFIASQQTLERLNGKNNTDKTTRINELQNLQAIGNIQLWKQQLSSLALLYPDDTAIQESAKDFKTRQKFTMSYASNFGLSQKSSTQRPEHYLRVNSPWIYDNYRLYTQHATFTNNAPHQQFLSKQSGAGLEWASKQKSLNLGIFQQRGQKNIGFNLEWQQDLSDYFKYLLNYNSATTTLPYMRGHQYVLNTVFRTNESRSLSVAYQYIQLPYRNRQQDLSTNLTQQLFSSAHHLTEAQIKFCLSSNHIQNMQFSDSEHSLSTHVNVHHEWLTWRSYDQKFTQFLDIGFGQSDQKYLRTRASWNAQYLHEWAFDRTWRIQYGFGFAESTLNVQDKNRLYGLLALQGSF